MKSKFLHYICSKYLFDKFSQLSFCGSISVLYQILLNGASYNALELAKEVEFFCTLSLSRKKSDFWTVQNFVARVTETNPLSSIFVFLSHTYYQLSVSVSPLLGRRVLLLSSPFLFLSSSVSTVATSWSSSRTLQGKYFTKCPGCSLVEGAGQNSPYCPLLGLSTDCDELGLSTGVLISP